MSFLSREQTLIIFLFMMTSSDGNSLHVTDPLLGESTSHQWFPLTKGQWWEALMFPLLLAWTSCWTNSVCQWFELPYRSCNVTVLLQDAWCHQDVSPAAETSQGLWRHVGDALLQGDPGQLWKALWTLHARWGNGVFFHSVFTVQWCYNAVNFLTIDTPYLAREVSVVILISDSLSATIIVVSYVILWEIRPR